MKKSVIQSLRAKWGGGNILRMSQALFKSASLVHVLDMNPIASLSISKRMFASIGFMFLFAWLIVAPCHANLVVTVGQGSEYDYSDFQDAIDYVLSVTNEEEATIKLAGGDYISQSGYQIPIGSSQIQGLRLEPVSSNDDVKLVGHQTPVMNCDFILKVIGNSLADKTVEIDNIFVENGAYSNTKGVAFTRGFESITVSECKFDDIERAIDIYISGSGNDVGVIKNLNILDNTYTPRIQYGNPNSVFTKIDIRSSWCQEQLQYLYRIAGNHVTGTIGQHLDVRFSNPVPFVPGILIEDNVFRTEAIVTGGDVTGYAARAVISLSYGSQESNYAHPIIRNNSFVNSGIKLTNISAEISANRFFETFDRQMQSHIDLWVTIGSNDPLRNKTALIKNNVFQGNVVSAVYLYPRAPHGARYSAQLISNSFRNFENVIEIDTNTPDNSGTAIISRFINNLCHAGNTVKVRYTGGSTPPAVIELSEPILARNCHFENDPGGELYQNMVLEACTIGDPLINMGVNGEYTIIWNETVKSPLINAGCPELDGVIQTDPDGTPPDIGAIYYPHHHQKYFQMGSSSNIYWLSFPVVDDRSNSDGIYWNELGKMFSEHMENAPNSNLNTIAWSYEENAATLEFVGEQWLFGDHRSTQPKGYKVQFNPGVTDCSVAVNGFKADPDTTPVSWAVTNNQNQPFENWIGYFVTKTNRAGDALSRFLPGSTSARFLDYVHTIKTQTWVTSRVSEEAGSRWIVDPNSYTLSEGQMVALLLLPNAPKEMYWNTDYPPVAPIVRPRATAFAYEEKLDYTPVFLDFDPEDMPAEVGLYVNGVCKGAAVVDTTTVDVALYLDDAKDGGELQVMFYYEGKGKKAAKGWKVYNPESLVFEDTGLRAEQIGKYAYLSFTSKEGDSPVPLVTSLKPNYPNPFNPETHISFILAQDMQAKLDIFNVRGQKVLTLCNAELSKGKHTLLWNGRDEQGRMVASGIYFSRLATPEGSFTGKMMLMK